MTILSQSARALPKRKMCSGNLNLGVRVLVASLLMMFCDALCSAQNQLQGGAESGRDNQINVNWLYGSYVPKEVPLEPLNSHRRLKLYVRQTYTGYGIYIKTTLFAIHDQVHGTYPEWETASMHSLSGLARGKQNS